MKRLTALFALFALICAAIPAYAAGTVAPTEEAWYVVSHSDNYRVYYYATVVNSGEKAVSLNDLLFEIQDGSGETIESTSKYKLYPEVLNGGEMGYIVITKDVKDIKQKSDIDHYALTITTKNEEDKVTHPLQAAAEYIAKDEDDNEDVLRATVTNSLSENAFDINIAMAARDASGKLLYIVGDTTKDFGLASGASLMERSLIKSDIVDELEDNYQTVATVDAIAYTVENLDD